MIQTIQYISKPIEGIIHLGSSKSLSNRALIIQALCDDDFTIHNISIARDTQLLQKALESKDKIIDVEHAGTAFRFLTAYLSTQNQSYTLMGSERMKERPIGPLVDVLRKIGAHIEYEEKSGFPPLQISPSQLTKTNKINITGDISSQFISSLLMIAPTLSKGLIIEIEGLLVSKPYVDMTLSMMNYFGVSHQWDGNTIEIKHQKYKAKDIEIEADWSSASYLFGLVGSVKDSSISIKGLNQESWQGDSMILNIMSQLGVKSTWKENEELHLAYTGKYPKVFEYNFSDCPDLAQTVISYCAANGITGLFTGMETLHIKETDRIAAMKNELIKGNVVFHQLPNRFHSKSEKTAYLLEGQFRSTETPTFETYQDHRMAMSLSLLASQHTIKIQDSGVINKSYPSFWEDLKSLGIVLLEN